MPSTVPLFKYFRAEGVYVNPIQTVQFEGLINARNQTVYDCLFPF